SFPTESARRLKWFRSHLHGQVMMSSVCFSVFPALLMTPVFIQGNLSRSLYLTSAQQLSTPCHLLHDYQIIVFLSTFVLTLLSITVSPVERSRMSPEDAADPFLSRSSCSWLKPAGSTGGL
uniref:Uncharacterized protein n=1 Tax=Kryptolebias marmoratus TaxID=37003 RepID=A0A3Q3AH98_KRYMA